MEWTSAAIKVWFWPRGHAPPDILGSSPNPSNWSTPQAYFAGGCNIDQHFMNNWLLFDNTFCGAWAGEAWGGKCAATSGNSCQDFVQTTPSAFQNAYWLINSLKVFQENGASDTGNTPTAATPAAPSLVAGPVSSSQSAPFAQLVSSAQPVPSSQATAPISSSSKPTTLISAPSFSVSTSVSSISPSNTPTPAASTIATSTVTSAASITTPVADSLSASSSQPESTKATENPTQVSSPEATPNDLLLWDEFGKGSKGIPDFANIPQRRRHPRHLQNHVRVRCAKTHKET